MEAFNKEEVFQMLQGFEENLQDPLSSLPEVPAALEEYLKYVAKTGDILYPWPSIKPFIKKKVELVLDQFHEAHPMPSQAQNPPFKYDEFKREILGSLDNFSGAPFTIQRLCELVTVPTKHYKRTDKFMRGLEKNVLVVTYVDDPSPVNDSGERPPTPPKSIFSVDASYLFDSGTSGPSQSSSSMSSSSSSSSSSSAASSSSSSGATANESSHYADPEPSTSSQVSHSIASSSKILLPPINMPPQSPAPLQQLDSFTTVFSSPPSTPLAVVSNMPPFEPTSSSSSSSSSGSSAESSPQPASPPSSLFDGQGNDSNHPPDDDQGSNSFTSVPSNSFDASTETPAAVTADATAVATESSETTPPVDASVTEATALESTPMEVEDAGNEEKSQPVGVIEASEELNTESTAPSDTALTPDCTPSTEPPPPPPLVDDAVAVISQVTSDSPAGDVENTPTVTTSEASEVAVQAADDVTVTPAKIDD